MFEAAVGRLGRSVAGAGAVEEREDVRGTLAHGAAELADLDQRDGNAAGDRVDHCLHHGLGLLLVGLPVGSYATLVDAPGRFDLDMLLDREYRLLTTAKLEFASLSTTGGTVGELLNAAMDPTISYDDLDLIRSMWPGKLVVKGVQNVADATRLVDRGVDGIILSNHGGRQLDRAPVPFHLLPHVVREVGKDATVMVETGIMNGADIVESIALGTKFTLIGRAYLYGLMAAAGRASTGPSPSSAARSNAPWPSSASQPSPNSSPATSRNSPGWSQSGTAPERRRSGEVAPRGPRGRIVRYRTKPSATTAECGRLEGG